MAWNARFLYRNKATVFTASDEVSTLPDGNLLIPDPSEVWRADTLTNLTVTAALGTDAETWDTVWLGYTNLTPRRNQLENSNLLNSSGNWSVTNLSGSQTEIIIADRTTLAYLMDAGTSAGNHSIEQTWSPTLTVNPTQAMTLALHFDDDVPGTAAGGIRLELTENSTACYVDYDFSTGFGSVSEGSGWSASSTSETSLTFGSTTSKRLTLTATKTHDPMGNVRVRIYLLDSGGSVSYTGANEQVYLAQVSLEMGSSFTGVEVPNSNSGSEAGALFYLDSSLGATTTIQSYAYHAMARGMDDWKDDVGWVHGVVFLASTVQASSAARLYISDENNTDSYVEAGVMMVGKSFQPGGALVGVGRTYEAGRRIFDLEFEYLTAAVAERDLLDMYQHVKKREGVEIETAGGQRYASDNRPVLCILDDAASASEPERVIYGTLEAQPVTHHFGTRSRTTIRIKELPQ